MSGHISAHPEDKAIEVATLLGDSVVDVKHCMDPHSGTIQPKTWAVFSTGLASLLASAVAFYVSVSTAAYNKAGLDYWTRVAHKPAHAYRPETISSVVDWVAFGGIAVGIVALAMALVRMRREKQSPYYRIGTAPDVEQPVEGAPAASFPLVAPAGDDFVFNFGTGMTGELEVAGTTTSLPQLIASGHARPSPTTVGAFELPIPAHGRIRTTIGQTSFLVSAVAKPRQHAAPLLAGLESRTVSYFAGSLGAHLGLVLLLSQIPVESSAANVDLALQEAVTTKTNGSQREDVPPEQQIARENGGGGAEGAGAAMALEEGAAGTTKSQNIDGHMRIKNNNMDPQLARQQAIEAARNAGILGSVSALNGAMFASITESGNLSSGPDGVDVWGPIYGADGEGQGTFGYGRRGLGLGGGCGQPPCGIIGTGPGYGKIGLGKYPGSGWDGPGGGVIGTRKHVRTEPVAIIGQPTSKGDLDRAIIRRYIKRNYDKIAYCYEKQLLAKPGLAGDIMVQFFIGPTGSVSSSTGSGFDSTVANCVADVVAAIEFPRPDGGGGVQVNYPFKFHAAGQ